MLFPGLPRAFPNAEWSKVEDIFHLQQQQQAMRLNLSNTSREEQWVQQELPHYESSYTTQQDLNVCVITFNVGCKKPALPLTGLAALTNPAAGDAPMDLVVFGFQEVDMSATAMFKEETDAATPWVAGVHAAIGADASRGSTSPYFALPAKQLVGLLLVVCVRRALLPHVSDFAISTQATGAMGSLGNKGAVGIHLTIHRTTLCVLTAHLAAGQANVSKRNDDINTILRQMDFNAGKRAEAQLNANAGVSSAAAAASSSSAASGGIGFAVAGINAAAYGLPPGTASTAAIAEVQYPELYPRNHDIILVAGDLNYRVNLTYEQAVDLARTGRFEEMLQQDQLEAELRSPHTPWQGFFELRPNHKPTYRYDIGTSDYDTSEKHRVPSFTDRIMVWMPKKVRVETAVRVDSLKALDDVMSSDHKPVQAVLRLPLCVEVSAEKQKVVATLRKKVAAMGLDKASFSRTAVDTVALDFGSISFPACGEKRTITVTNTGDCTAIVRVLRQRTSDESEGAWLRASPLEFAVTPGESQEVGVETRVDPRCLPWLGRWRPFDGRSAIVLGSTLLLCVRNGPTHAVECRSVLRPSVFGNSLDNVMLLGAVPCTEAYKRKEDLQALMLSLRPQLPKELWTLGDVISRAPREPGLFTQSVSAEACGSLMALLDTSTAAEMHNATISTGVNGGSGIDVHCAAECLLLFLRSLQEPVVPFAQYTAALAAGRARGKQPVAFTRSLPTMHSNMWVYTLSLLNFLLRPVHARSNELTAGLLAQVFSAALIIRPIASQGMDNARMLQGGGVDQTVRQYLQQEKEDARALVEHFLVTPPALLQQ